MTAIAWATLVEWASQAFGLFKWLWTRKDPNPYLKEKAEGIQLDGIDENVKRVIGDTTQLLGESEKARLARNRRETWITDGLYRRNSLAAGMIIYIVHVEDDVDLYAAQTAIDDPRVKSTDPTEPVKGKALTLFLQDAPVGNAEMLRLLQLQTSIQARDLELKEAERRAPAILDDWIKEAMKNDGSWPLHPRSYRHPSIDSEAELEAARLAATLQHRALVKTDPTVPRRGEPFSILVSPSKTGHPLSMPAVPIVDLHADAPAIPGVPTVDMDDNDDDERPSTFDPYAGPSIDPYSGPSIDPYPKRRR